MPHAAAVTTSRPDSTTTGPHRSVRFLGRATAGLVSAIALAATAVGPSASPAFAAVPVTRITVEHPADALYPAGAFLGQYSKASALAFSPCSLTLSDGIYTRAMAVPQGDGRRMWNPVVVTYYDAQSTAWATATLTSAYVVKLTDSQVVFGCSSAVLSERSSTSLSTSASSSSAGSAVSFTAHVSRGQVATEPASSDGPGSVTFTDAGRTISGCARVPAQPDASGVSDVVASCTTTGLSVGSHTIIASYAPDPASFVQPSTSTPLTQTIQGPSSTVVSCSPNPAVYPGTVTCKAIVTGSGPTPTGTVHWGTGSSGHFVSADCSLNISGVCSVQYTTGSADVGSTGVVIAAVYSGNAYYKGSEGKTSVTVTKAS
jgi:hypothetical protein